MGGSTTIETISELVHARSLSVAGVLTPEPHEVLPAETNSLILLGPDEPVFWPYFTTTPEYLDGDSDAMDRWSRRVIDPLAAEIGGTAIYPFGGTPYAPFINWAMQSHQAWASPVTLLVHEKAGLFCSYRGAIAVPWVLTHPARQQSPCETCEPKPCLTACPVGAIDSHGYDVDRCHTYLDSPDGVECMQSGCAVRRACPVSQNFGRLENQSAFHMKAFHP